VNGEGEERVELVRGGVPVVLAYPVFSCLVFCKSDSHTHHHLPFQKKKTSRQTLSPSPASSLQKPYKHSPSPSLSLINIKKYPSYYKKPKKTPTTTSIDPSILTYIHTYKHAVVHPPKRKIKRPV
jgi:hypothetical protein